MIQQAILREHAVNDPDQCQLAVTQKMPFEVKRSAESQSISGMFTECAESVGAVCYVM